MSNTYIYILPALHQFKGVFPTGRTAMNRPNGLTSSVMLDGNEWLNKTRLKHQIRLENNRHG